MRGIVPIKAGTRLGPYAIDQLLGAGGMGEVYRAHDTRLDRLVALKVLPDALAADAAHLARFQREAKTISALNHAHICALHDIGQHETTHYLVLELLEGETLATRIARAPLPPSQVERLGAQIADALAAAHRHGLVHRDLKPANIMVTATGVKLLDFGLAKAMATPVSISAVPATIVGDGPATAEGQIVGTLQYMAPEQVQGLATDARTDIFALGAVLYEMLTGRKAFEAPTPAGLIGRILQSDPPSIKSLAPGTPDALAALVERCLAKDPQDRWQSAHDVRLQLEWLQSRTSGTSERPAAPEASLWRRWRVPLAAALVGAVLAAAPLMLLPWRPGTTNAGQPRRFDMALPAGTVLRSGLTSDVPEISPDGRWVVHGATVNGKRQLHLRNVATQALTVLADNEDATYPFWAPDSRSVGFFGRDGIEALSIDGGSARVLVPAAAGWGASWDSNRIVFSSREGLYTIPAAGGQPTRIDGIPALQSGRVYVQPRLLPEGRGFLLHTWPEPSVRLASFDTPGTQLLADDAGSSSSRFAVGHLLRVREGTLLARPLDVRAAQFTGSELSLAQGVRSMSAARDGTILFRSTVESITEQPTWFDRKGARVGTLAEPGHYGGMTLSPDGRRAATWKVDSGNQDVWEIDLSTGVLSRMSRDPALDSDATWSPDGTRLAFTSSRSGDFAVYVRDVATGRETLAASLPGRSLVVDGWTPDGQALVVRTSGPPRGVFLATLVESPTLRPIANPGFSVDETQVSPDGHWVAYNSNESGAWEVYVARFPDFTSSRRVSVAGGVQPKWRGDGKELFYLAADAAMMSVAVAAGAEFAAERPVTLFATGIDPNPNLPQYGVTPDGQRFIGLDGGRPQREVFTVLLNWLTPENLARMRP
jgi:Tol biopolymer transport system component